MATQAVLQEWDEYVAANGVEALRIQVSSGLIAGQRNLLASAWLHNYDLNERAKFERLQLATAERATAAAEESARTARIALKCAAWSAVGTVASFMVAAWALFAPEASRKPDTSPTGPVKALPVAATPSKPASASR